METINRHLPQQQLRDGFTVGGSLPPAAVGRICQPTSKRNWYEGWARHTSLSYLLGKSSSKPDSPHSWDQMEALPPAMIPCNSFHLRPQYNWTDQEIEVHAVVCLMAFLLSVVAYRRAREKAHFQGSPHTLLENPSAIRMATLIESPKEKTKGPYKVTHCLEEMDPDIQPLAEAIGATEPKPRSSIPFSVYVQPTALS